MENQFLGAIPATVDEILSWWQAAHFVLSSEQQVRFRNDSQIPTLINLHGQAVKEAILLNKITKLKDIYLVASALQTAKMMPVPNRESETKQPPKKTPAQRLSKVITRSSTQRGRDSFREHGMINPPPVERLNIDRSKLPKCSICKQPIVGTTCGCW